MYIYIYVLAHEARGLRARVGCLGALELEGSGALEIGGSGARGFKGPELLDPDARGPGGSGAQGLGLGSLGVRAISKNN